jgi:hypothetical protein
MTLVKGVVCSAIGALFAAAAWVALIKLSGWSLWLLAPVIGGAAGFGMMRGTQMKGGLPAGLIAAGLTLGAIFGARWIVVSQAVEDSLAVSEKDAAAMMEDDVAREFERGGLEVYDKGGEYTYRVRAKAWDRWSGMSEYERHQYMKAKQAENSAGAAVLTPLGLLLDFGVFGTVCAVLAAGTALKTGSATLEGELARRGLAEEEVAVEAKRMRDEDAGPSSQGRWALPVRVEDRKAAPKPGAPKAGASEPQASAQDAAKRPAA